jgi:hypothetical protein
MVDRDKAANVIASSEIARMNTSAGTSNHRWSVHPVISSIGLQHSPNLHDFQNGTFSAYLASLISSKPR